MNNYEPQYSLERDDDHPDNWSRNMDDFSGIVAPLYLCPNCGEVWRVQAVEEVDTTNDEIYEHYICSYCYRDVRPITRDNMPVCHPLTVEEMYWDNYSEDEDESDYE